ncbi:MAG TPA: cytochrome c peroxidase [Ferruginibacter sp.]|nr:cytochrome c peroxidase [Ferruginibacter sp.]
MKTRVIIFFGLLVLIAAIYISACKKNDVQPGEPHNPTYIDLTIPAGWPTPTSDIFANNKLTEEGFQLGKKLFYDGKLSKDGNFPCASCHQQFAAFATFDHDFSHGFDNSFTTRNAPGLFNLAWMTKMHWDGGINHIEVQPLAPITAQNEMAENIDNVLNKLRADTEYPALFKSAFGNTDINSQRMLKALAQFMGSIISSNSKYDKVQRGEASFTATEQNGYDLFKAKCETCHKEPLFTDNSFRNTGLAVNPFLNDFGRMRITNDKNDSLKFKVPSLRNVMLTFPYAHDGRFYSIGAAIDHYRTGIITTQPTLDPLLVNRIAITNTQKNDLIYFLNTLTDTTMTKAARFAQ